MTVRKPPSRNRKAAELGKLLDGKNDPGEIVERDLTTVFSGKSCSEVESIRWVAGNMRSKVSEEDAPSGVAWEMLNLCRTSMSFRIDFFKSMWMKLLPRQVEPDGSGGDDEYDGMELVDVINRLEEHTTGEDDGSEEEDEESDDT